MTVYESTDKELKKEITVVVSPW